MKKILLIAAMLIASVSAFSHSFREVVYLKNGSVVKGDIVEFKPDKLIKMESSDGSYLIFEFNEIDKITRERVGDYSHSVSDNQKGIGYLNCGYRGFVSAECLLGDFFGGGLTTTHGKQMNEKFFVGGGVGMFIAENTLNNHYSFPVFADMRVDFLNKKISPFADLRAGVDFAFRGATGFYGDFSVGCRFNRANVSFGVNSMRGQNDLFFLGEGDWVVAGDYDGGYYYDYSDSYYRAFNFVTRFSFEF